MLLDVMDSAMDAAAAAEERGISTLRTILDAGGFDESLLLLLLLFLLEGECPVDDGYEGGGDLRFGDFM
jgi:hypothetical protein